MTPRWIGPLALVGAALVLLPLIAMGTRVDWVGAWPRVTSDASLTALSLSLRTASAATLLCLLLGAPLGIVLHRWKGPTKAPLRALVLAPLVLPPVVGGIALLYAFGASGLVGRHFEAWGFSLALTTAAVIIAQAFVSMPFMVIAVESALAARSDRHERIAATLGARPTTILRRVTLPALGPALATGSVLAFARSLGEFGATLTFAGSVEGITRTLSLQIYMAREADPQAAVVLGFLLVVIAVVVVTAMYRPLARTRNS
jgi:molybdate transport system permease protein